MQEIMASESFYDEMERIYAPENEKTFCWASGSII